MLHPFVVRAYHAFLGFRNRGIQSPNNLIVGWATYLLFPLDLACERRWMERDDTTHIPFPFSFYHLLGEKGKGFPSLEPANSFANIMLWNGDEANERN